MNNGKNKDWLTQDNLMIVEEWAKRGLSNKQIADNMDISTSTLYDWRKKYSEFSESLSGGKKIADEYVENSLHKIAVGYEYEEIVKEPLFNPLTGEPVLDRNGKQKIVVTKITQKVAHPNMSAITMWLKKRKPELWGDKKEKPVMDGEDDDL